MARWDEMIPKRSNSDWPIRRPIFASHVVRVVCLVLVSSLLVSCWPLRSGSKDLQPDGTGVTNVSGRFVYKSPDESISMTFRWKSEESAYELTMSGPLGLGRVVIRGTNDTANILTPNGETLENVDLQRWLADEFSISIPILELPSCLDMDCTFAKEGENHVYDSDGRLIGFENQGWKVSSTYGANQSDKHLVKELHLKRENTEVRLIFDLERSATRTQSS